MDLCVRLDKISSFFFYSWRKINLRCHRLWDFIQELMKMRKFFVSIKSVRAENLMDFFNYTRHIYVYMYTNIFYTVKFERRNKHDHGRLYEMRSNTLKPCGYQIDIKQIATDISQWILFFQFIVQRLISNSECTFTDKIHKKPTIRFTI